MGPAHWAARRRWSRSRGIQRSSASYAVRGVRQDGAETGAEEGRRGCLCHRVGGEASRELIPRTDGIERVAGPNVHLTFVDCGGRIDVRIEIVDRENFPIAGSTQYDDLAMLAGNVDFAVDADGRGVVIVEGARQTCLLEYLAGLRVQRGCDPATSDEENHVLVNEGRRHVRQRLFESPAHVRVGHVTAAAELHSQETVARSATRAE